MWGGNEAGNIRAGNITADEMAQVATHDLYQSYSPHRELGTSARVSKGR